MTVAEMSASAPVPNLGSRIGELFLQLLRRGWLLVVFGVGWHIWFTAKPSLFIPPMGEILGKFFTDWFANKPGQLYLSDFFYEHAVPSLERMAVGWGAAIVIGVTAGIVLGIWRPAAEFFDPLIKFGMSVPSTALLPIAFVIFGITNGMNIFLITVGTVWTILLNTIDGVKTVDRTMLLTARSLRVSRRDMFFRVFLPGASPQIVTGLRVSLGIALILMVVSELFAASEGIGFYIVLSQRGLRFTNMWSGIVLVGVLGLLFNAIFSLAEHRVLRWHKATSTTQAVV